MEGGRNPSVGVRNLAENRFVSAIMRALTNTRTLRRNVRVGPGRKSVITMHRRLDNSRYTGAMLRKLRAERGVGRPPVVGSDLGLTPEILELLS